MSRRDRIEEETARLVEERLHWLLTENGPEPPPTGARTARSRPSAHPRRSRPDPTHGRSEPGTRAPRATGDDVPGVGDPDAEPSGAGAPGADATGREPPVARDRPPRPSAPRPRPAPPGGSSTSGALLATIGTFRRPHLVIVAVVVALGLLIAGWAVLRARPVAVAVTPPATSAARAGSADPGGSTSAATSSSSAPAVVVHVLGAVREPGLVTLPAGSRVQDALDAADGLTGKADPGELNLAQPVTDGQQIVVGTKNKPTGEVRNGSSSTGGSGSAPGSGGAVGGVAQPVNLNTATQAQLEELPGVGPVMAGKIIAWRTEHGRFASVEELQEIDGVGPKTYAKLAPLCGV